MQKDFIARRHAGVAEDTMVGAGVETSMAEMDSRVDCVGLQLRKDVQFFLWPKILTSE